MTGIGTEVCRLMEQDGRSHIGLDPIHQVVRYHPMDALGTEHQFRIRTDASPDSRIDSHNSAAVSRFRVYTSTAVTRWPRSGPATSIHRHSWSKR